MCFEAIKKVKVGYRGIFTWVWLAQLFHTVRSKTKTNRHSLAHIFPSRQLHVCIGSLDCLCPLWLARVMTPRWFRWSTLIWKWLYLPTQSMLCLNQKTDRDLVVQPIKVLFLCETSCSFISRLPLSLVHKRLINTAKPWLRVEFQRIYLLQFAYDKYSWRSV